MSERPQKKMTFIEYVSVLRSQIILVHEQAKELTLKHFDDIAQKLEGYIKINESLEKQIQDMNEKKENEPQDKKQ